MSDPSATSDLSDPSLAIGYPATGYFRSPFEISNLKSAMSLAPAQKPQRGYAYQPRVGPPGQQGGGPTLGNGPQKTIPSPLRKGRGTKGEGSVPLSSLAFEFVFVMIILS